MSLTLVTGGVRSGKSARAEALAAATGRPVRYVGTADLADASMAARVAAHAARRPPDWTTVEAGASLAAAARGGDGDGDDCVLVDGLGAWIARALFDLGATPQAILDDAAALAAAARERPVIVVAEQAGLGLLPPDATARAWLDLLGEAVQCLAARADRVEFVVAGAAIALPVAAPAAWPNGWARREGGGERGRDVRRGGGELAGAGDGVRRAEATPADTGGDGSGDVRGGEPLGGGGRDGGGDAWRGGGPLAGAPSETGHGGVPRAGAGGAGDGVRSGGVPRAGAGGAGDGVRSGGVPRAGAGGAGDGVRSGGVPRAGAGGEGVAVRSGGGPRAGAGGDGDRAQGGGSLVVARAGAGREVWLGELALVGRGGDAGCGAAAGADTALAGLRFHGDTLVRPGDADHAVTVLAGGPPAWLREVLHDALDSDVAAYPDERGAVDAVAALHGRAPAEIVPVNGAAHALWLLPAALRPALAACVHPAFTEAEAALRAHGVAVVRVQRDPDSGFALDPAAVPDAADLVVVGNPASPSGTLDPAAAVLALRRPGRVVVVDEAFMDLVPGEPASLVRVALEDVVVVRSLTKSLAVPGLRAGYAVAAPPLADRLRAVRPPWSANGLALAALRAAAQRPEAFAAAAERAAAERADLERRLDAIPRLRSWRASANYCLVEVPDGATVTAALRARGIAVRPAASFPGLGAQHLRVTARAPRANARFAAVLTAAVEACP